MVQLAGGKRVANDGKSMRHSFEYSGDKSDATDNQPALRQKLQVTLDDCLPDGFAGLNLSRLCRMALNMRKNEKTPKTGIAIKRQNCGWDNNYLLKVLLA